MAAGVGVKGTDLGALEIGSPKFVQLPSTQRQLERLRDLGAFNFKLIHAEDLGACSPPS